VKNYPKILLPTNLSQSACDAADFILSLLGRNAEYELLNSFPLVYRSGFYDSFQNYTPEYDEIPIEKLKRERNRLLKKFGNQSIEIKAMYGDPVKDLIKTAENDADLVVIGEDQFYGWSQQKISKVKTSMVQLEIPLIFVPPSNAFEKVDSVVLIQDAESRSGLESIELMQHLCKVARVGFKVIVLCNEEKGDLMSLQHKWNAVDPNSDLLRVKNEGDLNASLAGAIQPNSIIVSNIEYDDVRLADAIQNLFEDKAIVQTKLLMPRKSSVNFLRGA